MCKVERAIILAAGFGTRLLPLTEVTPKPLIDVNGKIIIERMIEALKENGIDEINIVVVFVFCSRVRGLVKVSAFIL